jgi:hypothetical protein
MEGPGPVITAFAVANTRGQPPIPPVEADRACPPVCLKDRAGWSKALLAMTNSETEDRSGIDSEFELLSITKGLRCRVLQMSGGLISCFPGNLGKRVAS